ncbi:MAG: MliC family protein [Geminicoccaceae bacterium]
MKVGLLGAMAALAAFPALAADGPSFDCGKVEAGSIEALVCGDAGLSALDRQLATVFAAAKARAGNEHPAVLVPEQRGWIKGRDDCWKATDPKACVADAYRQRIVELQARYRLVEAKGPFSFVCGDSPADEVTVTYFATEPSSLIAERGDQTSLMLVAPSGSGARYVGRNESFWEHQGEATVVWGYGAPELRCRLRP